MRISDWSSTCALPICRGSISNMREYVAFLNGLAAAGAVDLDAVEAFWIERVHEFFSAKPFKIRLDASRSLRTLVRDMIAQSEERQRNPPGMQYAGAVLQHLVGQIGRASGRERGWQ